MKRIALFALLTACSGSDSDSGATAESAADTLSIATAIGGIDEARPEYEFGRISGVAALPDGRVAVADFQNNVIRVYREDGTHQMSFARHGQGPGEVDGPCCLAADRAGHLWVRDGGNARYNIYELLADSARYIRQVRMAHTDVNRFATVSFDAAGNVIDIGSRSDEQRVNRTYRFHLDSAGKTLRETALHAPPDDSTAMKKITRAIEGGEVTLYSYQPYGPQELFAHASNGQFAHALNSRYAIDWRNEDGSLLRTISHEMPTGPALSAREAANSDTAMQQQATRLGITVGQLGFGVPTNKPPLRSLFFDDQGRLWVELSVPEGAHRRAHIYDTNGSLDRTVVWPADITLHNGSIRGGSAWGVRTDSLEVATLVRLQGYTRVIGGR